MLHVSAVLDVGVETKHDYFENEAESYDYYNSFEAVNEYERDVIAELKGRALGKKM